MFIENTEELAQNKLLLLYIIKRSNKSLTNSQITEFVLEKNYMNYFLIQQYLSELIESNFVELIKEDDVEIYHILNKGQITLNYFEERIPVKIKEELDKEFFKKEEEQKKETQVVAEYFQKGESHYVVNLKLVENEETLFSLYLNVATISQAEMVCNTWKNNTEFIYQNFINILVNEKITPLE